MIVFKDIVSETVGRIKENKFFADKKIMISHPYAVKPYSTGGAVVAVGLYDMEAQKESLGQEQQAGTVRVYCDCFFPYDFDSENRQAVLSEVCKSVLDMGALCVYAAEPYTDKTAQCVVRRLIFTFRDETDFS